MKYDFGMPCNEDDSPIQFFLLPRATWFANNKHQTKTATTTTTNATETGRHWVSEMEMNIENENGTRRSAAHSLDLLLSFFASGYCCNAHECALIHVCVSVWQLGSPFTGCTGGSLWRPGASNKESIMRIQNSQQASRSFRRTHTPTNTYVHLYIHTYVCTYVHVSTYIQ